MEKNASPLLALAETVRERFRGETHRPVPADLCDALVQGIDPEATVFLYDAGCVLALTLLNQGHNPAKIYLWERRASGKTYFGFAEQTAAKFGFQFVTNEFDNINRVKMNFDYVIGNPPYSDTSSGSTNTKNLDSVFVKWAIAHGDTVSLIIRAKHFHDKGSALRKQLFAGGLTKLEYLPENTFKGVYVRTCRFTWQKGYTGTTEVVYSDGSKKDLQLDKQTVVYLDNPGITTPEQPMSYRWKRGKLNLNQVVDTEEGVTFIKALGRNPEPETATIDPKSESLGYQQHAVVIANMGSENGIGRVMVKPYEAVAGHSIVQLWCDSEAEAVRLAEYLSSPEMKEYIKAVKFSNPNSKALFDLIPDLPA